MHAYDTEHGDNQKEKNEVGIICTLKNLLTKLIIVVLFWNVYSSLQQNKKNKRSNMCSQNIFYFKIIIKPLKKLGNEQILNLKKPSSQNEN